MGCVPTLRPLSNHMAACEVVCEVVILKSSSILWALDYMKLGLAIPRTSLPPRPLEAQASLPCTYWAVWVKGLPRRSPKQKPVQEMANLQAGLWKWGTFLNSGCSPWKNKHSQNRLFSRRWGFSEFSLSSMENTTNPENDPIFANQPANSTPDSRRTSITCRSQPNRAFRSHPLQARAHTHTHILLWLLLFSLACSLLLVTDWTGLRAAKTSNVLIAASPMDMMFISTVQLTFNKRCSHNEFASRIANHKDCDLLLGPLCLPWALCQDVVGFHKLGLWRFRFCSCAFGSVQAHVIWVLVHAQHRERMRLLSFCARERPKFAGHCGLSLPNVFRIGFHEFAALPSGWWVRSLMYLQRRTWTSESREAQTERKPDRETETVRSREIERGGRKRKAWRRA